MVASAPDWLVNLFVSSWLLELVIVALGRYSLLEIFKSCSDKTVPFGYEHSDLKNIYLTSQDLASRLAAPILTQSDYLAKGIPNYN